MRTHLNQLIVHLVYFYHLSFQWQNMDSNAKRKLQRLVLPDGIVYHKTDGKFGTAKLSPIFALNELFRTSKSVLVAGAGIEPAIFRL